jgi:small subunit ribosomal protein S10
MATEKKPAAKKETAEKAPKKAPAKKAAAPKKESILAPEKGKKETKKATASDKQKIRVIIRAFDHKIVDESSKTIIDTAERTGSLVTGPIPLPTKIERVTVNRSTFVNKDAREQFEIRTHKRLIDITEYTTTTIEALSNLNLPAGVDVEIKMM